jgi:aquaporin related protein
VASSTQLYVHVHQHTHLPAPLTRPQVTFGLWLINALKTDRAILCFISQMIAGICAAAVISAILPGDLNVSTTLGSGVSAAQGVFLEMFLTSLLVITIFMLAAEKHKATFLAPIGIGLSLFVAEMVGVFFTGGSLNPTRSFGPCVVTRNFPDYHYIYWFGPAMGTLLAFGVYKIIKSVEYETVNPGQDFDDHEVCLLLLSIHLRPFLLSLSLSLPPSLLHSLPPSLLECSTLTFHQAAAFNPPDDPDSAEQVERPNVAAIAARDAVRRLASNSTDEKEQETSSVNGDGAAANSGGIDTRMWRDQHEAHRSGGFERGTSQDQIERRRSSRETRTTRDQMAFDAEMLSRSGHGSMKRGPSSDAWV